MKLSLNILLVAILMVAGIWYLDIVSDQRKAIKISKKVAAYNDWECSHQSKVSCRTIFEVLPVQVFQVERIRYGKDYMAVKISLDGKTAWVISGEETEVYENPNT